MNIRVILGALAVLAAMAGITLYTPYEGIGVFDIDGPVMGEVYLLHGEVREIDMPWINQRVYYVKGRALVNGSILYGYTPVPPIPVVMGVIEAPAVVKGNVTPLGRYVKVGEYYYIETGRAFVISGEAYR